MLKEKNLLKAIEQLDAENFDPAVLTMEQIAEVMTDLDQAKAAYDAQAELVKDHHKRVYGPMCEIKAQLEIGYRLLELKLEKVKEVNKTFAAFERLVRKNK